ncbi:hypothetical protein WJX81_007730 [Elliptochloris bilobata]|uniref:Uncharacterized protein n=1 Tax=Elliptochloris bilobata TaxID=381761 RepID=A0AAW1QZH7_9CHLO
MEPQAAYRTLLRLLKRHLGGAANSRPWLEHVASEFRSSAGLSAAELDSRLQLLKDYVFLLQHTHEHLDLLLSYNIGIDRDARQRDTMRRSAASVGLQLPEVLRDPVSHKYGVSSRDTSGERAKLARHAYDDSSGGGGRGRQR